MAFGAKLVGKEGHELDPRFPRLQKALPVSLNQPTVDFRAARGARETDRHEGIEAWCGDQVAAEKPTAVGAASTAFHGFTFVCFSSQA